MTRIDPTALIHLTEECGELAQAVCKILRFGPDSTSSDPAIPKTNRRALEEEAGDVLSLIRLLTRAGLIDKARLKERVKLKTNKLGRKYL